MRRLSRDGALALLGLLAAAAIALSLTVLLRAQAGLVVERVAIGSTPATLYRPAAWTPGPVVVVAHGFAGSQPLMAAFAVTAARNGYAAITFDFPGHGRNPEPLAGNIIREDGATRALVEETAGVLAHARAIGDGRLALVGHSMASDIVIRAAQAAPDVAATIAVSPFSRTATATSPPNLLAIVGGWEGRLKEEALRVVGLATAPEPPRERITYGDPAAGTGRRAAFVPGVEHIGVLYSPGTMDEALAWLDASFGAPERDARYLDARGPWIALLVTGLVVLARPLARLLPVAASAPAGAGLPWARLWPLVVGPALLTPLILRFVPTRFLPVLVADYVAAHFALYGALTALGLWLAGARGLPATVRPEALVAAGLAAALYAVGVLGWAVDAFVASFAPGPGRTLIVLAMLAGTVPYFLADEWLTRGQGAARGAYLATKAAFLVSLAIAVALDPGRLFFLVIIVPATVALFLVHGLLSAWIYRRTRHPAPAALANALAFAWALGVTFPLLAG